MTYLFKIALAGVGGLPQEGIVPPCDPAAPADAANACNMNALLTLGENIVNTLISLAFIIAVLFLIVGAFRMIISQGSPEGLKSAKSNITSAVIGLVIVLVSWVVLNSFINAFVPEGCSRDWYKFKGLDCSLISVDINSVDIDNIPVDDIGGVYACSWTSGGCAIDQGTIAGCREGFYGSEGACALIEDETSCELVELPCRSSVGNERDRNR